MPIQIQLRRDAAANWTSIDPVLANGEPALETDTGKEKVGDGVTAWTLLAYKQSGGGTALTTTYDNTDSGLAATNVKAALDEIVVSAPQQLITPTLNSVAAGNTQCTLNFTNPNSFVEDNNQIEYKLNSSGTWLAGVVAVQGEETAIQTGLANGSLYDFRITAKGSGIYSDSVVSNTVSQTPTGSSVLTDYSFTRVLESDDINGNQSQPSDSDPIQTWADLKNANDRTQPTLARRPSYNLAKDSVYFSGSDSSPSDADAPYFEDTALVNDPSQFELFLVVEPEELVVSSQLSFVVFAHRSGTTELIQVSFQTDFDGGDPDNTFLAQLRSSGNVIESLQCPDNQAPIGSKVLVHFIFDKTNDSFSIQLNDNSAVTSSTDYGVETFSSTIDALGTHFATGAGSPALVRYKGHIYTEAIKYNTLFTTQERTEIRDLINTKHSIW